MARIRKARPKPHVVITDTSTVWHEDKHYVVDPEFDKFWKNYADQFGFELVIPEVVRGEILFQQTTSATKGLKKANQAILDIQRVTHRQYSHRITEHRVRQEVELKFQRWAESKSAKVLLTPTDDINWPKVIRSAIWREPPFLLDSQIPDNEKGFRDCLILETVKHFCSQESREIPIAFLCKDKVLRETTEAVLAADKRFSTYELISDFKTYLDLTKEKLEGAFIKAIVLRAHTKFYAKGDPECLYFRDNVMEILKQKYNKHFENPEVSEDQTLGLILPPLLLSGQRKWEPADSGMFWISRSQFVKTDDEGQYVWLNTVTYVRQYGRTEMAGLSLERTEKREESSHPTLPDNMASTRHI